METTAAGLPATWLEPGSFHGASRRAAERDELEDRATPDIDIVAESACQAKDLEVVQRAAGSGDLGEREAVERVGANIDGAEIVVADSGYVSFEAFYRDSYHRIARALAYTLFDTDLAREACDEAMVRAYARWSTVKSYEDPSGWVYRVALNWARDVRRRLRRQLRRVDVRDSEEFTISDPAISVALRELDVDVRAVVVCRLLLDWSVEQTATALHIKPGTVKSRLHRATALLERKLGHMR